MLGKEKVVQCYCISTPLKDVVRDNVGNKILKDIGYHPQSTTILNYFHYFSQKCLLVFSNFYKSPALLWPIPYEE